MVEENRAVAREKTILELPPACELSLVEHQLIGSTYPIKGEFLNVKLLLQKACSGNNEAKNILLTPVFLQQNESSEEAKNLVLAKRQEEKILKGFIPILAANSIKEAIAKGLEYRLVLSGLDEAGLVIPNWKIYLVDRLGNVANDVETLNNQQIEPALYPGLSLSNIMVEQGEHGQIFYRTITLSFD